MTASDNTFQVGFVGLGAMGRQMAANLARVGQLQWVWNRSAEKAESFVLENNGVSSAISTGALAAQCDLIFTCVSADEDLREVIGGMQKSLKAGTIVVDSSTVSATVARDLSTSLAQQGVEFIDAPVSGGVEGAINGTLSMMVGGSETVLERIRPVLACMTARVIYMGPTGAGQATKAVNQIMAAGINQAVSEALAFAEAMDLDMDRVIDAISGGAAANWFLQHRGPTMAQTRFAPGFKVALHHKDLKLCKTMLESLASGDKSLPIVEMTLIHYQRLMDEGFADEDISALLRLKRRLFEPD